MVGDARDDPMTVMTADQFKSALAGLGWSEEEAAAQLGAGVTTRHLVSEWCQGKQPVPKRVALHMRAALQLRNWVEHRDN